MGQLSLTWQFILLLVFLSVQCILGDDNQAVLPFKPKLEFDPSYKSESNRPYASPPRPSKPAQSVDACGGTRYVEAGEHGFIESPGYPSGYSAGLDCEWSIQTTPDTNIQATLFEARTSNNLFADISDSVYMSLTGDWNNSLRYSGDFNRLNPLVLVTEGNQLLIHFRSSSFSTGSPNGRGFRVAYYASNRYKPAASEPGHDTSSVVLCNYVPVDHPQIWPCAGQSKQQEDPFQGINRTNPNPFLAALILDGKQFCSGTLVSERHVVTSAHCTRGVRRYELVFGSSDLTLDDAGVQRRFAEASDVTSHPYFDPATGANDISVITLKENITLTRFVFPAELPNWNYLGTTLSGLKASMVGWGDAKKGTVYTQVGEVESSIEPNSFCRALNRASSGSTMCTRKTDTSLCQGDSGSPVFTRSADCGSNECSGYGDGGGGVQSRPPHKPNKPNKPKPAKPNKPNRPRPRDNTEGASSFIPRTFLVGVLSHGSCSRGFSITRITAYLDFLSATTRKIQ